MTVVSLIHDPLRHLFPSSFFLQKKIKRLILTDGTCSGQWFYRTGRRIYQKWESGMDGKCHQSTVPGRHHMLTRETDLSGILRCDSHLPHLDMKLKCIKTIFFLEMCFLGTDF